MGWLQNLFKSKELLYLEQLYSDTKKDKEQLQTENKTLRDRIDDLNKQLLELTLKQSKTSNNINETVVDVNINPQKLAPKEKFIFKLCNELNNYKDVLNSCGMKEGSLKVYLSRIRTKGHKISWEVED